MRIAMFQMRNEGSVEKNLAKSIDACAQAAAQDADLILFPEVQLTEFFPQYPGLDVRDYRVSLDSEIVRAFCDAARKYHIMVVPNLFLKQEAAPDYYETGATDAERGEKGVEEKAAMHPGSGIGAGDKEAGKNKDIECQENERKETSERNEEAEKKKNEVVAENGESRNGEAKERSEIEKETTGTTMAADCGKAYDASILIDRSGRILGIQKMVHIAQAPQFYEQDYYIPSDDGFHVFETEFGKIGIVVCFDRHYPESIRTEALQGADLILIPTVNTKAEPAEMFRWEIRVQAFQNSVAIAMCNRVGTEGAMQFSGESIAVDANGSQLLLADDTEQLLYVDIDLPQSRRIRSQRPYTTLRRPELYAK